MLENRSPTVFVVTLVLAVLATVFVALRLASKGLVVKKLSSDDVLTVVAWFFATALSITIMIGTQVGLGAPDEAILDQWGEPLKRSIYAFTVFYNPALMATKTAILILYRRMAAAHPFLRYASIATGVVVNLAGLVLTLISIFQCRPIRAAFDSVDGECVDVVSLYLSSAPINVLTDLAILLLPLPILTRLRMEFRQKCALVGTFIVGGFVTIVDVVRIIYLQNALREERDFDSGSTITAATRPPNFTYHASFSLMWSAVEVSVGLMCCCVLVLKPLIMRVVPGLLGRVRRGSRAAGMGSGSGSGTGSAGRDMDSGGSDVSKEHRPQTPTTMDGMTSTLVQPPAPTLQTNGFLLDLPRSPKSPRTGLAAIPELRTQGLGLECNGDGDSDGDGDDGMDFFQMLASDPSSPIARARSISNASAASPATTNRQRMSEDAPILEAAEEDDEDGMDFFQMLAADPPTSPSMPPVVVPPAASLTRPRSRSRSLVRRATISVARKLPIHRTPSPPPEPVQEPLQVFFDFVNMRGKTPLTELTAREAWWPIMFVSSLFFLWGFAYGLLGTLNAQIQTLLEYEPGPTLALHNAYWLGYFLGPPLCGYWVLTREGFKAAFMTGLAIYATGAMSFWPSSVLKSYPGFFISNVIVALGLSVLEVAANPFITLAGPGELSETRLLFAQGIQGLGSIVSPILAYKALFSGIDEEDLFRVQYCYLAVALFVVALAVVFFYVPLSEATDDELEAMATQRLYNADLDKGEKAYRSSVDARRFLLYSGVVAMATYVGAQQAISYFWPPIIADVAPLADPFWMQAVAHALFACGRFLAAGLTYFGVAPRHVMLGCIAGSCITSILGAALPPGNAPLSMLVLMLFFEAPLFPLIFAMTLRGQGKHTKWASSAVTMAISGGAIWPSVGYSVDNLHPNRAREVVWLTMALYAVSVFWPAGLSASTVMRRWVDPKWSVVRLAGGGEGGQGGRGGRGEGEVRVIDWASPTLGGKRDMAHVESTRGVDAPLEPGTKEPDLYTGGVGFGFGVMDNQRMQWDEKGGAGGGDVRVVAGSGAGGGAGLGAVNPLGITAPGRDHFLPLETRKRSVTWEKDEG